MKTVIPLHVPDGYLFRVPVLECSAVRRVLDRPSGKHIVATASLIGFLLSILSNQEALRGKLLLSFQLILPNLIHWHSPFRDRWLVGFFPISIRRRRSASHRNLGLLFCFCYSKLVANRSFEPDEKFKGDAMKEKRKERRLIRQDCS
jgi:hypothetical protein